MTGESEQPLHCKQLEVRSLPQGTPQPPPPTRTCLAHTTYYLSWLCCLLAHFLGHARSSSTIPSIHNHQNCFKLVMPTIDFHYPSLLLSRIPWQLFIGTVLMFMLHLVFTLCLPPSSLKATTNFQFPVLQAPKFLHTPCSVPNPSTTFSHVTPPLPPGSR